jgi:hypothetical protein
MRITHKVIVGDTLVGDTDREGSDVMEVNLYYFFSFNFWKLSFKPSMLRALLQARVIFLGL